MLLVMALIVYGDFNCPFSALASHRIDLLLAAGTVDVEFRAVEHDPDIPLDGRAMVGDPRDVLAGEIAQVKGLLTPADGAFDLRIPEALPNTASMCRSYATTPTPELRRELFEAVWGDAVAAGVLSEAGSERQASWQREFDSWDKKVVPSVVLEDGYVSRGLGGLKRLADLLGS